MKKILISISIISICIVCFFSGYFVSYFVGLDKTEHALKEEAKKNSQRYVMNTITNTSAIYSFSSKISQNNVKEFNRLSCLYFKGVLPTYEMINMEMFNNLTKRRKNEILDEAKKISAYIKKGKKAGNCEYKRI